MLDEYFAFLENKRENAKESGNVGMQFRISGIGYCERKQVYNALGFEKKKIGQAWESFSLQIGTAVHEILQDDFMKAGLIDEMRDASGAPDEVEIIREDLRLSGHVDGIYRPTKRSKGVLEFKTTNSMGFAMFDFRLNKPKKAHIEQVNSYAGFLSAKECKVIYVNTNGMVDSSFSDFYKSGRNQRFREFTFKFDEILFQQTLDKIQRMCDYVDRFQETGELPPKIYDKQCNYCEFKWTCKPTK